MKDAADEVMELDLPVNEVPCQKRRRRLTILFFLGLFFLSAALELHNRGGTLRDVLGNIMDSVEAVTDPTAPIPSVDGPDNALVVVAVLRNMLPAMVMLLLVLWLGSRFMQAVHGMSSLQEARRFLSTSLFGTRMIGGPFIVVSKGDVLGGKQQPPVRIGGPGMLIVYNDSAVLLEQAGRLTRVVGPGFHPVRRFEKIRDIVDLRPRWYPLSVSGMSREGIPVKCTVDVHYQVSDQGAGAHPATDEKPHAYSEEAVFKAATTLWLREFDSANHADWGALVAGGAEGTLRAIMARYPLDRLIQPLAEISEPDGEMKDSTPPPRQVIQRELETVLRNSAADHGAKLLEVALRNIELEDPVTQQWIETWKAQWKKRRREELAAGKAEHARQMSRVKAETQKEMIMAIVDGLQTLAEDGRPISDNAVRMRFLGTLEQVVGGPQAFSLLPNTDRMIEALRTLPDSVKPQPEDWLESEVRFEDELSGESTEPESQEQRDEAQSSTEAEPDTNEPPS